MGCGRYWTKRCGGLAVEPRECALATALTPGPAVRSLHAQQCRSFCDSVSKRLDKMRAECDGAWREPCCCCGRCHRRSPSRCQARGRRLPWPAPSSPSSAFCSRWAQCRSSAGEGPTPLTAFPAARGGACGGDRDGEAALAHADHEPDPQRQVRGRWAGDLRRASNRPTHTHTHIPTRSYRLQAHGVDHGPHEGSDTGGGVRRRRPQQRPQQRQEQPDRGAAPAASAALAAQEGEDSEATALLSGLSEEERQVLAQENRDLSERLNKEAEDVRCVAARRSCWRAAHF